MTVFSNVSWPHDDGDPVEAGEAAVFWAIILGAWTANAIGFVALGAWRLAVLKR